MESNLEQREQLLMHWLQNDCGFQSAALQPMTADASMRRYFRFTSQAAPLIAMDAPPPQENCRPYIAIAAALRNIDLQAPCVYHANVEKGFLVISDFGDATYLKALNAQNADMLYLRALDALSVLQSCRQVEAHTIPPFTGDFMWKEWAWHKEWFLEKLLNISYTDIEVQLNDCYRMIVNSAIEQPQVFMHRDYHSGNLMVLEKSVGILDFQDAFIGPVTYDLASILRDCYIDWPEEKVMQWVRYYYQTLQTSTVLENISEEVFLRWFDLMCIQRHLKALLTFARKQVRDQQPHYLQFIPRTLQYLLTVTKKYSELKPLHQFLSKTVQPKVEEQLLCVQ